MSKVFRQIKSNDVHQRPFKAYKHYKLNNSLMSVGYVTHSATYYGGRIDHNGEIAYPLNSDGTNKHVAWHAIKQKFYSPRTESLPEHVLNPLNERTLHVSASTLTIPYNDSGERIKNDTIAITSSCGALDVFLEDDGDGNLIDTSIDATSFASSSKNFFYMSFNDKFNDYREYRSNNNDFSQYGLGVFSGSFTYELSGQQKTALNAGKFNIVEGIAVTSSSEPHTPSGLACRFLDVQGSHIRIPHEDIFDSFGHCDDWTISFWTRTKGNTRTDVILSKHALTSELKYNTNDNVLEFQDFTLANLEGTAISESRARVPFHVTLASNPGSQLLAVEASDGTNNIAGSIAGEDFPAVFQTSATPSGKWCHWLIRNSGSLLQVFANGSTFGSYSGSLPDQPTANKADITIGNRTKDINETQNVDIAEIRMYDYAVNETGIQSLANNNYISASCYQTNIVGNVFHRNGQIVASSPLPKHNTGSGIFSSERSWDARWRGVHTIYENQVFVRVPKDVLNVSINPTATYKPPTDGGDVCTTNQNNVLPGERRKDLFISGTLKPYITSIGCYNDEGQMLAVAKLAQPIQKRDDIDMNFVVRWDY